MRRRKTLLSVLMVAAAVLLSFPGTAWAESAQSGSDEQINAAVRRILENRHSAEDVALVKSVPEVAQYVPDPNSLTVTVEESRRTPLTSAGGFTAAAAEFCGTSEAGLGYRTLVQGTIYEFRQNIVWCDDNTRITRIISRSARVTKIGVFTTYNGVVNDQPAPGVGGSFTRAYMQAGFTFCYPIVSGVCQQFLPYVGMELRAGGTWGVYDLGDARL